jgi:hypothetical protein
MNCQPKSISTIPTLLGVVTLVSLMGFAADRLPKGWIKAGSHPVCRKDHRRKAGS